MSGPEAKELVNRAQAVPRDSLSNCLKERISSHRVTTRDIGKKVRQNFSLSLSQLPSMLSTEEEYHFFAPPLKKMGRVSI
jgi:hypothetical protein